jgi:hypothetical protein
MFHIGNREADILTMIRISLYRPMLYLQIQVLRLATCWTVGVRFLVWVGNFSLLHRLDDRLWGSFLRGKAAGA